MLQLCIGPAVLHIGHGVRAAAISDQQTVTLGKIARLVGLAVDRDETAIGVIGFAGRNALGDDPAARALAEMDHLGAGIGLLAPISNGDGVELADTVIAAQDAARIFPGHGRPRLDLRPADLRPVAPAVAALGHEIVDAALAVLVARPPVLHGGILDLGIFQRDQFHNSRVQLILVAHRRRTTFQIGHIRAFISNDERALELAGILGIHAEIGRQFHRAAHALGHIDKGPVREDGAVQRRKEIVRLRHHRAEIFFHQVRIFMHGFRDRHEDHAGLFQLLAERGGDGHGVENGIDGHARRLARRLARRRCGFGRTFDAQQDFRLAQRDTQLFVGFEDFLRDVVNRLILRAGLGRGIVIIVLVVDGRIIDHRPGRLFHGQPAAIGRQAPFEQPFRLFLLG